MGVLRERRREGVRRCGGGGSGWGGGDGDVGGVVAGCSRKSDVTCSARLAHTGRKDGLRQLVEDRGLGGGVGGEVEHGLLEGLHGERMKHALGHTLAPVASVQRERDGGGERRGDVVRRLQEIHF